MRFDRSYLQLAFLSGLMLQAHAWAPTVTLTDGIVIGTQISLPTASSAVNQFLGIPFAQSPPERFSPPSPPKPWTSPLSAQAWKDSCIQQYDCALFLLLICLKCRSNGVHRSRSQPRTVNVSV